MGDKVREALELARRELECCMYNAHKGVVCFDGDGFHEALTAVLAALATPPQEQAPGYSDAEANEKLLALADKIDHEQLWRRAGLERPDWTQDQRDRCSAGVMLRRYASLLGQNCWRIFPPQPGISFQADTLDAVVKMARKEEKRTAAPSQEQAKGRV